MSANFANLRFSPLSNPKPSVFRNSSVSDRTLPPFLPFSSSSLKTPSSLNLSLSKLKPRASSNANNLQYSLDNNGGGRGDNGAGRGGGKGGGGSGDGEASDDQSSSSILGLLLSGWRSRVAADPQFPFKVLMEEVVGVTACMIGDMASRPNFGLNELDFVFSTLVVGSIMNFVLMYLLAPTLGSSSPNLPSIFSSCPPSHMFEPGAYGMINRVGTFVYKGALFAGVGFAAGLVGTAISNGLIKLRKKMDPNFETPNKPPPTLLNALTWAAHMGLSSNLRYQTLNGVEFLLAKGVPPVVFKVSVLVLRCLNNVLGGFSFVTLARLTGSQKVEKKGVIETGLEAAEEKVKLIADELQSSSHSSNRITRRLEKSVGHQNDEPKSEDNGLLPRSEISLGEHPLSLGKISVWNQFFQDSQIFNTTSPKKKVGP